MHKINTIGVDLAKNVIQVTVVSGSNRELSNGPIRERSLPRFWHGKCRPWWRSKRAVQRTTGPAVRKSTATRC